MTTESPVEQKSNGKFKGNAQQILDVEVAYILASPTNPRKTFPKGAMDELAQSIQERGVKEPVTLRAHPKQADFFELVHGERRWRASKKAGRGTLPAILIEATDQEVLELQLLDASQHEDLNPLEEGSAYSELHARFGVPVLSIAKRISKSVSYVYGRLTLTKLEPDGKKALTDGKLTLEAASIVARVPPKLQKDALADLVENFDYDNDGAPVTGDQAGRLVRDHYMLKLADALFDRGDAELVKKAGACTTCPKRTGNQAELFADVASPDTCTDPDCYKEKTDVWWGREKAAAEAKGKTILSDAEAKNVFSGTRAKFDGKYVDLKEKNYLDPKGRTWAEILKKDKPPVVLGRDEEGGVHELVLKTDANVALKKIGGAAAKLAPETTRSGPDPHTVKMQREAWVRRKAADQALGLLVGAAAKKGPTVEVIRVIVYGLIREVWAERIKSVVERRGLAVDKTKKLSSYSKPNQEVLEAAAKKMPMADLLGLAVELVASRDAYSVATRYDSDALAQACEELKVDWGKCQADAKKERADKDGAKKKPKPGKAVKKAKASK